MLRYGMKYVDQGGAFYEAQHKQSQIKQLKWKAAKLGYKVTSPQYPRQLKDEFLRSQRGSVVSAARSVPPM
jgi:methyl coenzyme M reductase alpha subunit